MSSIKVIQIGVGPIGQAVVRQIAARKGIEIVAAVDIHPDLVGKNLGQVCKLDSNPDITISDDLDSAVKCSKPDVAVLTTSSSFRDCTDQTMKIIEHGLPVVSTCEEMAYPWDTDPKTAKKLDEAAQKHGVAVLGTGVNPGFLMDFLPASMTAVCKEVKSITVSRIQDASHRRIPFQQKIGAALNLEEFEALKQTGKLRHVGLTESIQMIANAMNWNLDKTEDILTPIIAEEEITTGYKKIAPGMAAGVQQIGKGYVEGKEIITLLFRASVGEKEPRDTIEIDGTPNILSQIPGGVNGDIATCSITVNAVKSILKARPGLRVMTDIPTISYFSV